MTNVLNDLRQALGLRSGENLQEHLFCESQVPSGMSRWLTSRHVHEFFDDTWLHGDWEGPLTLLAALAGELASHGAVAWIGRRCWPTFQFAGQTAGAGVWRPFRHLFLDPLSDPQRMWSIAEAARCPAVRVIVADAGGLNMTQGRQLQLAAEAGNAVILLVRPISELSAPSWATTRWRVNPLVSSTDHPQWEIELVRATGARQGQDASRHWTFSWTYEVFRGTGALHFSPRVGPGTGAAATSDAGQIARQTA